MVASGNGKTLDRGYMNDQAELVLASSAGVRSRTAGTIQVEGAEATRYHQACEAAQVLTNTQTWTRCRCAEVLVNRWPLLRTLSAVVISSTNDFHPQDHWRLRAVMRTLAPASRNRAVTR